MNLDPNKKTALQPNVLLILAHPDPKSFGGALAQSFAEGARNAGCNVEQLLLSALSFDAAPGGRPGPLEPELLDAREKILRCHHLVLVYPTWFGAMPARMKGFFERVFGDGFAMRPRAGSIVPEALLKGRSADVLVTMDTPPLVYRFLLGAPGHKLVDRSILRPSGFQPVRICSFGPLKGSSDERRASWLARARKLGTKCRDNWARMVATPRMN